MRASGNYFFKRKKKESAIHIRNRIKFFFLSYLCDFVLCSAVYSLTFQSRQAYTCIKSVTSFVKIFSSVEYRIFYFISSNIFLLYKTAVTTVYCLFVSSFSITDDIAVQPILKGDSMMMMMMMVIYT